MDDGYAPQSPDLSALHGPSSTDQHHPPPTSDPALHTRESFSLPGAARPDWAQQPHLLHHSHHPQLPHPHVQYHQDPYQAHSHSHSHPRPSPLKYEPLDPDYIPSGPLSPVSHHHHQQHPTAMPSSAAKGQEQPLPVIKTKFPIARIKRIVQADEDVGKVAQATPVAVSKALEQFMISLARRSADEARARGSKKVTAADMKSAVTKDEVFDFLSDVVERIPDAPVKKSKAVESESDDEPAGPVRPGRKRKAAGGRRKKEEFDDD